MTADWLALNLHSSNYKAAAIHGDKPQGARDNVMNNFRAGHCFILIATDVASRGLDVSDIAKVINFNFPLSIEDYVHRIGRTGRAGKKGLAISFLVPMDFKLIRDILDVLKQTNQEISPELLNVEQNAHRESKEREMLSRRRGASNTSRNFRSYQRQMQ